METKLTFRKGWCRFWLFIASIFQDKMEGTSTKRVVIIGSFILFAQLCVASQNPSVKIDENILTALVIIILGGIGLTIPEWFSKLPNKSNQ